VIGHGRMCGSRMHDRAVKTDIPKLLILVLWRYIQGVPKKYSPYWTVSKSYYKSASDAGLFRQLWVSKCNMCWLLFKGEKI